MQRSVGVIIGKSATELERYAARELCGYLEALFDVSCRPTTDPPEGAGCLFLVGSVETNPAGAGSFPGLGDQGILLRRTEFMGARALIVGGGSPRATLWAVYELAERWGVRFLLSGDVLPEEPGDLLPELDLTVEPVLTARQWRVVNDFACGPESWGMAEYRVLLGQLAKLKFNRILLSIWPWQPFLHFEIGGIARESACLWFDFHYPITDDMVGRELFGDEPEFWNPDLPYGAGHDELASAGERLLHNIMECAHGLGMECVMTVHPTEFPPEFAPLLKDAQKVHQLAELTVVPGSDTEVEDPGLTELASGVLRAVVDTYPEVDYLMLGMPEFRQWVGQYRRAWEALDARYGISDGHALEEMISAAEVRNDYPGGAERAVAEVKGDLVMLYFYDRLLTEVDALKDSRRPDVKFVFGAIAEELYPLLGRILPAGSEVLNFVDYTPSRIVERREALEEVPGGVPALLIYTLHDDNVGPFPQLTTGSLHELTGDLVRHGWTGFSTRYWLVADHDPCVGYLSKAAWVEGTTPEFVYGDLARAVCGEACIEDMLTVFREVEEATVLLEWHGLSLGFPVPGMMMKHWTAEPMPENWGEVREHYLRGLEAARAAAKKARPSGRWYAEYWAGRLTFGVEYLNAVEALREAAIAEAEGNREEAVSGAERALESARRALEAYAGVARDQSDRGAIATMNEYVYRALRGKVEELRA